MSKPKGERRVDNKHRSQSRQARRIGGAVGDRVCAHHQTEAFEQISEHSSVHISRSPYLLETIIRSKAPNGIVRDQEQRDTKAPNLSADALDVGLVAAAPETGNEREDERFLASAPQKTSLT